MMITSAQIKAARVMLSLKQKDLADLSGISVATINNIERGAQTDPKISTLKAIQQSLEHKGIDFINEPLKGVGVCLKPVRQDASHATILIVDDNKADRLLYKGWLKNAPDKHYTIVEADGASTGVDAFVAHQPDCVILDFMMYGADGFQLIAALRRDFSVLPPIIFVTGMHNEILEESARTEKVHAYLNKNIMTSNDLCDAVNSAVTRTLYREFA